jgi:hypothetical protein
MGEHPNKRISLLLQAAQFSHCEEYNNEAIQKTPALTASCKAHTAISSLRDTKCRGNPSFAIIKRVLLNNKE